MDPRIGSLWLITTCVCIVMISCCISGVACDVPDDVVYTDLHKTVRIGDSVVLKCQFRGTPLTVYWMKGDDPHTAPTLVSYTGDPATGSCVGGRLCRIMEMNAEFSLIIKEVSIAEQGLYVCTVKNYKGIQIHNLTDISVFSPPKEPYPIINECQMISPTDTETTCTISTNQAVEISCSASGYFPDINLYFLHGSTSLPTKDMIEVTNLDGTKNKTIYANATASEISYVCFASIPGSQEQKAATVLVNLQTSSSPMLTGPTIPIGRRDGTVAIVVVPVTVIVPLAVICVSIVLWRRRKQQRGQGTDMYATMADQPSSVADEPSSVAAQPSSVAAQPSSVAAQPSSVADQPSSVGKIDGIISYFELEKLVEKFDNGSLSLIVAELIEDSKGELESERTKADLYKCLCEWKESSSGSAILLYSAMEKNDLGNEDFLASINNEVSDDDLEHICWHVHSCRKTVQPIVDPLQYSSTSRTKPTDNDHISAPSRYDEIWDDLQIMKRWKTIPATTTYGDEDEHCDETVKFLPKSGETGFKSKHTESMPSNRMIQLCRDLEKAGRTTGDSDGHVYHQLSKTFYKIREEFKSELTDEVLKKYALNITKRHCQKLEKPFNFSADAIANRNKEDLEMFRTDDMLKAWVRNQKCSNYEIRRRLRQAAEQCNRQDIADNFISKEQSEVMPSTTKLPACMTITNENQSPGASRSENVTSISRDELNRIGCYAGSAVLLAFCKKYDVTVPEQQSPDEKEVLCEIINVLKPTLDSEFERIKKEKKSSTPRKTLRNLLENEHPSYACLLAMKKTFNICDVELIDLAFRLIMADVYPFAKALNISDQVLKSYRRNISPSDLTQGTANIMKQVNTDNRVKMVTPLRQAGYSEEARALYFGFEISSGDVIEVEKRVNMAQLTKQLGISDDVQSTGPGNVQVKSVLLRWRDTVCSSTFNHRLVLADALFRMGEKQLALDIISGVHRNMVINKPMLELLVDTVPKEEVPTLKVLEQKTKNEKGLVKWSAKSPTESSNELLRAGCYAFAYENMAVFGHGTDTGNVATKELRQGGIAINKPGEKGKETKEGMEKATNGDTLVDNTRKEGTRKGLELVAKDNHTIPTEGMQEANTTEEGKGGSKKNEDKNSLVKEATDTNNVIAEISREEKNLSLTNEEEVMQEKSRDGAAESKENTTENIDTKEQGNTPDGSDECKQDESSKHLIQAGT